LLLGHLGHGVNFNVFETSTAFGVMFQPKLSLSAPVPVIALANDDSVGSSAAVA